MICRFPLASSSIVLLFSFAAASIATAQTYDVSGQAGTPTSEPQPEYQSDQQKTASATAASTNLSWGSSIDIARQARAAQDALKRNDYPAAVSFAERAAKSAPQDAELWFLLGYAARLDERYQVSVDAYNRGLKIQPNSAKGMAGLAQTYARMGRDAEAEQLLRRVVDANPNDATSLQLAGELLLSSDPNRSLELLRRADALQASAHTDLLIARVYQNLSQPDESARFLNRAKARAPKDPDVLRAVAGQYREQGQYALAISALQAVPVKTTDLQAELAYTYQLAGRLQDAANLYSHLAKSAKGNIGLDLSAAQAWIGLGQTDTARGFLEDAQRIDSNNYVSTPCKARSPKQRTASQMPARNTAWH